MSQFDIAHFEDSVNALVEAHARLHADYRSLRDAYEDEQRRNKQTRERLNAVIDRIRALEAEADNV